MLWNRLWFCVLSMTLTCFLRVSHVFIVAVLDVIVLTSLMRYLPALDLYLAFVDIDAEGLIQLIFSLSHNNFSILFGIYVENTPCISHNNPSKQQSKLQPKVIHKQDKHLNNWLYRNQFHMEESPESALHCHCLLSPEAPWARGQRIPTLHPADCDPSRVELQRLTPLQILLPVF